LLNERQRMKAIIKELANSINVLYQYVALQNITTIKKPDTNQIKYEIT